MARRRTQRTISSRWAYDIDKNPIDQGEIWDADVINQSIELILGTAPYERVFNPAFGFGLQFKIFNLATNSELESLLDEVAIAISTWEDRITVIEKEMRVITDVDRNSAIIVIPYVINRTQIRSTFKKKIFST